MRQPYLLYKRTIHGKKAFYVKVWDEKRYDYSIRKSIKAIKDELGPKGARFPHTSKAGADALVQLWIKELPKELSTDRLDQYLLGFWEEGSNFLKSQGLRGKTYSKMYVKNNHSGIETYFLLYLDDVRKRDILLHQTDTALLESFLNYMTDKGDVGVKRINDILQAVKVALSEAYRLGLLADNPGARVRKLQTSQTDHGIFSPEEVKLFFKNCDLTRHYGINLLAATTGMRLGECRGLLKEDVNKGFIEVCHNWQDGEGMKEPKWGSRRLVPIPTNTQTVLEQLIRDNPFKNEFVFWGNSPDKPFSKETITKYYNRVVEEKMKIKDRRSRKLTFHAWRHFYNSMLRGELPDHALRKLTGHSSESMTENYTQITDDQRKAITELAEKIFTVL